MSRAWFKFYGRDFRDGVRDLPWEVTGIYSVLLTIMYETPDGRLKDHDQRLARLIGCDIRLWKRARATLIQAGKLEFTQDGFLVNPRCAVEVSSGIAIEQVRDKLPIATPQLIVSNTPKPLKSQTSTPPNSPLARAIESEPDIEHTASLRSAVSTPRRKPTTENRYRINFELELSDSGRAFAAQHGFLNGTAEEIWERFKNHHDAKGTLFASHEAGWRTWVLNEKKFQGERHGYAGADRARPRPRSAVEAILSDVGRKPG